LRVGGGSGGVLDNLGGVAGAPEEQREGVLDHRVGAEDGYGGWSVVVWHFGWLLAWERTSRALCHPDRDIRLLAAARNRESSEEGREGLARAMREFL
jgi:hypothetical protein